MKLALGAGLLFVGAFAMFVMNVTKTIPFRLPWGRLRQDEDPEGFRRYLIFYGLVAGVGALLLLAHYTGF